MRGTRAVRMGAILTGVALVLTGAGAGAALGVEARPLAIRATGPLLLDEDFRGVTAIDEFRGHGAACLTGAPVDDSAFVANGPLRGCPTPVAPPATTFPPVTPPISPPLDAGGYGYLRLTDAVPDQTGAALYEVALPTTDGVEITFEQWQYGGYSTIGAFPGETADGISFFLVDGTASLIAPGAFGGSLGYASKLPNNTGAIPADIVPGVVGGYLGIGFDVLGNYFGDWEQRGRGCTGAGVSPAGPAFRNPPPGGNMVTVRGPVGADTTLGYCFVTASYDSTLPDPSPAAFPSLLPGVLHGTPVGPVPGDPATAESFLEPAKRVVTIVLEPEPTHNVTVYIDFGSGPQQVLSFLAPEPVPPSFKFGFAASTGSFTDVHLIRTMRVQALDPVPALSLSKTAVPLADPLQLGDQVRYDFVVTNTGGGTVTDIVVDDPTVGPVTCPQTELLEGAAMTCHAFYTITQADLDRGEVLNTAVANGEGRDGPVTSNEDDARVDLSALAPSGVDAVALGITAAAALAAGIVGLVLALRGRSRRVRS